MKKGFLVRFVLALILLLILYEIWPLPFWLFSKKVTLPLAHKSMALIRVFVSPFELVSQINNLSKDNQRLENENQLLKSQGSINSEKAHVCTTLQKEIGISKIGQFDLIPSRVLGRTPSSSNQIIIIDKGKGDGVQSGAAVLSNGYLVGIISQSGEGQSEVKAITSHNSLVPAVLEKSRLTGLVQGGLEGLTLTEVPVSSELTEGETVLTSGLGGDLPSGIIIGKLKGEIIKSSGLFQSSKIDFPIQISSLEVVSVVKK